MARTSVPTALGFRDRCTMMRRAEPLWRDQRASEISGWIASARLVAMRGIKTAATFDLADYLKQFRRVNLGGSADCRDSHLAEKPLFHQRLLVHWRRVTEAYGGRH